MSIIQERAVICNETAFVDIHLTASTTSVSATNIGESANITQNRGIQGKGSPSHEHMLDHVDQEEPENSTKAKVSLLGKDKHTKKSAIGVRARKTSRKRWRTSQQAEDYMKFATRLIQPPLVMGPYGNNPLDGRVELERPNSLGFLTSPLRRPTVIEKWSPLEISLFEGAISTHGKHFKACQRVVKTKTTKELVEFYYVWKMTSHYDKWKQFFEPEYQVSSDDEEEEKGKKVKA